MKFQAVGKACEVWKLRSDFAQDVRKVCAGAQELCEQGGGARLSRSELDRLLLLLFPHVSSVDTAFVAVMPTTVSKYASCKTVHKLLRTGE